ncbi:hypothetical protein [Demequina globuliformis]|uniref:hypothetical protein n=1 Tax=Demequina globuliformis TaxID=676202 RepID=UPI0007808F56|nr:hypothetical protein [Demequina globuliformis]
MTDGELTFEEVSSAVDRSLECMRELGFHIIDEGIDDSAGYPKRMYTYSGSPAGFADGGGDEGQACLEEHSFFVESAWYDAPQSVAGRHQKLESVRPQVIACLSDIGIDVPDTATYDELLDLNLDGYVNSGTDCVVDAGIPSY